jgi:hypothetical protein
MKISIPLTGTLVSYSPLIGDDNDIIRPIELDLGNVSWQLLNLDLEHDLALIEVNPVKEIMDKTTGKMRPITEKERQDELNKVEKLIAGKSIDELYSISGSARLKKPK